MTLICPFCEHNFDAGKFSEHNFDAAKFSEQEFFICPHCLKVSFGGKKEEDEPLVSMPSIECPECGIRIDGRMVNVEEDNGFQTIFCVCGDFFLEQEVA